MGILKNMDHFRTLCIRGRKFSAQQAYMEKKYCHANFCLSVSIFLESQKDNHRLSDQQRAIDHGQNPLPIYTAVNVKNNYSTLDFKGNYETSESHLSYI